ncbi:hypothetical protein VOLCADRAFT_86877 [Volvox carteri f. nagariensis]|uniref:Uncharacterized protein n=1 Tax=Volvox carteri f. nagariensis TaxID=3068 RepID=D8TKL0_VOLCA|nr:uncharacterized protein VOLCADRAFT_86877 [Volvox carteri f. nagariensis]EFJ51905.1 hypothetical protein VOLCADRAFT_86877 [Volvox carteri f. nagariensis]|eukprot:XP_002946679.1 hypothetical protein VOLCADRAFT_86877 [Volvox carteri f. nagariensis]
MAGPTLMDSAEDAEEFIEKVDEVHRLIEGLKAGTVSPDYIDSKQKQKEKKERERQEFVKKHTAGRGPTPAGPEALQSPKKEDEDDHDAEAERRERAMAKVKELMANRQRKLHARARYEEYVKSLDKTRFGTDYTKWDIWCPEDEEDDLINSIGPNTPQFKAMEKDIDERHRQLVERRQLAERCRVRGNEAYKARQYSEALRCYQQGIESERTNMALHANAAMAALKINCFVQAVEHCDKVLSIADFLHNNRRDPLVVKALQRRAEAYRALQQPGRAVEDLQSALELEPGNTEVEKQLAKARLENEEARKQRAIARAVGRTAGSASSGSNADAGAVVQRQRGGETSDGASVMEAGGVVLDLEKLGRLERLAAALAPVPEAATATGTGITSSGGDQASCEAAAAEAGNNDSSGSSGGREGFPSLQTGQQPAPGARRGPTLPPRRQQANGGGSLGQGPNPSSTASEGPAAASTTASICSDMRSLLRDDDACCVYLRECGGLQNIAARITAKRPAPGSPSAAASASADLSALLLLLNDACMNDGNLKQLPALKVLPAVVAALGGNAAGCACAGDEEAAAVTLLCTAVTNEDVRREVSRLLGAGAGTGLVRLVELLGRAKPTVQGVALALLGNCMVDRATKAAMATVWRSDAATASCFLGLLRSPNAVLVEKVAVLLGNMATDAALRTEILAANGGVVRQLLELVTHGSSGSRAGAAAAAADQDLQRAAATALFNLTVDEAGQRLVGEDLAGLANLHRLAAVPAAAADRALAARAAGVCARAAKTAAGSATLLGLGAVADMAAVVSAALDGLEAAAAADSMDSEALAAHLDAAIRILTILTSPDDAALAAQQLVDAGGVAVLLRTVQLASGRATATATAGGKAAAAATFGAVGELVVANAALCLAGLARRKEYLALLRDADPVPVLVGVAYEGRGNTASKNAAIALARLAHEPTMLERLRELHGIEIIYQYVKP